MVTAGKRPAHSVFVIAGAGHLGAPCQRPSFLPALLVLPWPLIPGESRPSRHSCLVNRSERSRSDLSGTQPFHVNQGRPERVRRSEFWLPVVPRGKPRGTHRATPAALSRTAHVRHRRHRLRADSYSSESRSGRNRTPATAPPETRALARNWPVSSDQQSQFDHMQRDVLCFGRRTCWFHVEQRLFDRVKGTRFCGIWGRPGYATPASAPRGPLASAPTGTARVRPHGDRVRPCRNTAHALLTLEVAFSHRMHLRARPPRPSRVPHGGHAGTPRGPADSGAFPPVRPLQQGPVRST